ncbi:hypothetical protein F8388_011811 [Cannabis sativa]|uniref:GPI ethanolamine phosphate transferase 1 C-terminal domain-containing protein n=1 Tax=Cannabis sativa TaxID=3483 RepID=A0A7J6FJN8_CANSA|nr:hypothetical protein F8388_011811 [Cannabis sativa]
MGVEQIKTWKRLDDDNFSKIDEQILWSSDHGNGFSGGGGDGGFSDPVAGGSPPSLLATTGGFDWSCLAAFLSESSAMDSFWVEIVRNQMVLFNVAFFGTGNFASIASFEISSVYRFITIFNVSEAILDGSLAYLQVIHPIHARHVSSKYRKLDGNW